MWVKMLMWLPFHSVQNTPAAASETMARTLCQALLIPCWGNLITFRAFRKKAFHESFCQALAVMTDFVQEWWWRASPFGKSTAGVSMGTLGLWPEAPAAEVAPGPGGRSHWPQPPVAAMQHWRMDILVPTCLVVGQREGPVTGNASSCLPWGLTISKEAAACPKPCRQCLYHLLKSSPEAEAKCRRLTGKKKKSLSFPVQDLQGVKQN